MEREVYNNGQFQTLDALREAFIFNTFPTFPLASWRRLHHAYLSIQKLVEILIAEPFLTLRFLIFCGIVY